MNIKQSYTYFNAFIFRRFTHGRLNSIMGHRENQCKGPPGKAVHGAPYYTITGIKKFNCREN